MYEHKENIVRGEIDSKSYFPNRFNKLITIWGRCDIRALDFRFFFCRQNAQLSECNDTGKVMR